MMLTVNEKILKNVFDDSAFQLEAASLIEEITAAELAKEDDAIDFSLLQECSDMLIQIESGTADAMAVASFISAEKMIRLAESLRHGKFSTAAKVLLAAAILLASGVTVFAINKTVENNEATTVPPVATQAVAEVTDEALTEPTVSETSMAAKTTTVPALIDSSTVVAPAEQFSGNDGLCVYKTNQEPYARGKRTSYTKQGDALAVNYPIGYREEERFDEEAYVREWYGTLNSCEETPDKQHRFTDWEVTKQPTCGTRGEKRRRCELCGREYIYPIAATGKHVFDYYGRVNRATYQEGKGAVLLKCKTCGSYWTQEYEYPTTIVLDCDTFVFDGTNHTPKVIAVLDSRGYEVPKEEYTVYCAAYDPGKPGYNVSDVQGVYISFSGSNYYETEMMASYATKPPVMAMKGVTAGENSFTPFWADSALFHDAHNDGCLQGFEIEYDTGAAFSSPKTVTVKGMNKTSCTVSDIGSGTYYVRIRVYAYDYRGEYYTYGPWSEVRSVKI